MIGIEARRGTAGEAGWNPAWLAGLAVLVLAAAIAIGRGFGLEGWAMLAVYSAAAGLVVISDLRTLRAPNRIVYPALVAALAVASLSGFDGLLAGLGGGAISFALLLVAVAVSRGAMGMGDAKFGAVCGVVAGIRGVAFMLAASFIAGGAFALLMLALRRRQRRDVVAFTPFLVLGTLLTLAVGRGYFGT